MMAGPSGSFDAVDIFMVPRVLDAVWRQRVGAATLSTVILPTIHGYAVDDFLSERDHPLSASVPDD
jgi:hypothetical protein